MEAKISKKNPNVTVLETEDGKKIILETHSAWMGWDDICDNETIKKREAEQLAQKLRKNRKEAKMSEIIFGK